MPYISTEALIGGALVIVLAIGFQFIPKSGTGNQAEGAKKASKKRNRKKTKGPGGAGGAESTVSSAAVSAAESDSAEKGKKKGNAKGKGKSQETEKAAPAQPAISPAASTPELSESDAPSFAAAASQSTKPAKPKLLAEKLLPKPRKTKVDDMLAPEDRPGPIARVMKITHEPSGSESPSSAFSPTEKVPKFEDDYAESTSDSLAESTPVSEDEWNVVSSKKKPVSLSIGGSSHSTSHAHSSDAHTKLQRKNQKKAEAKKAQKAAEEADRLRRLAMHKRDLERQRINDLYKAPPKVIKQHGKVVSGGASATLSEKGHLVWD